MNARGEPAPGAPPLAILIPTFSRAGYLKRLLDTLAADRCVTARRLPVLVSDNASTDATAALVRDFSADHPELDLQLHVQPSNVGMIGNMGWLVAHAPGADYVWLLGDDDLPEPGIVGEIVAEIESSRPALLHLPSRWESADGTIVGRSPCPERRESYASSLDLLVSNYCLHFVSSAVVAAPAMREALGRARTDNIWAPHIWFGVAGRLGPCVVLPRVAVVGGLDSTWLPEQGRVLTSELVNSFAAGMSCAVSEAEFVEMLDLRYDTAQGNDEHWMAAPRHDLIDASERFPASRELRRLLVARGIRDRDPAAIAAAAHAAQRSGARDRATAELDAGETLYAQGQFSDAAEYFNDAVVLDPANPEAWCNLGVVRHALGDPSAGEAFDMSLAVAPEHLSALQNRAAWHAALGRPQAAQDDLKRLRELAPTDPATAVIAEAVGALSAGAASLGV